MAITYPLTLPTVAGILSITLRAVNRTAISESQYTFQQKIFSHPGKKWEADVVLPPMQRVDAETWLGFLISLQGHTGKFTMGDPAGATSRGIASWWPGTPLVKGASQMGGTLAIDGAPALQTAYLMAGDYIQLGSGTTTRLHKVLMDADSDASGNVTLEIWPSLRISPADNATVVVKNALGLWRLSAPSQEWSVSEVVQYGVNFGAVEAVA